MRIFGLLGLMAVLALQGCSSKPVNPTSEAIHYALQAETTLRYWVTQCADVSPNAKQSAYVTQQNWWQRNGAFVEGADFGLAYSLVNVTDTRAETGSRVAMALTWQVMETAEQTVNTTFEKENDKEALCSRVMSQYSRGEHDLRANSELYNTLVELQRRQQRDGVDLSLKRAAVEQRIGKVYGRSFYVVEKLAQRQGCFGAQVNLLKNAWPYEVYDARCPDGSFVLVRCEWGNCGVLQ